MAITLKGIRLESLEIQRDKESGEVKLSSASYALISSADKVLANQTVGKYGGNVAVTASLETITLLDKFIESYKRDITMVLGLEQA